MPKEACSVKYKDLDHAIKQTLYLINCASGDRVVIWFSKTDLKSAFRILGTSPRVWWLMILKAPHPETGEVFYFIDKCLPFRHSISCALFQSFLDALEHILGYLLCNKGVTHDSGRTTNYLDDFLFIALAELICQRMVDTFLELCVSLNVPVAQAKTEWPTNVIIFLGILLNGVLHFLAIPEDKRCTALNLLRNCIDKKKATVKDLQRLTGVLIFLNSAIVPGRAFTHHMYSKFSGKQSKSLKQYHHVCLDREFKDDCRMWVEFLTSRTESYYRPFIDLNTVLSAEILDFKQSSLEVCSLNGKGQIRSLIKNEIS